VKPNRIDLAFGRAHSENRAAFMPFLTAGDPDLETTAALIVESARRGADVIELGIPFSDPIADGPTIQASFVRALERGLSVRDIFAMIRKVRSRSEVALLTMVSFSIVARVGARAYFDEAAAAGADGVIMPDLSVEESRDVARQARAAGLHPVFLVAPTTPEPRMRQIARRSRGFIYYISVAGTTGARDRLPDDLAEHIRLLKSLTRKPVAVGFGISRPEHVRAVAAHADGVIVGSAIVRRIHELSDRPREEMIRAVGDFVAELAAGVRRGTTARTT